MHQFYHALFNTSLWPCLSKDDLTRLDWTALKSLHWLPVKYRNIFKVLLITCKTTYGLAPVYISDLISIRDVSLSRFCLRSTNSLTLNYPALKSCKTLRDRSFFVAAPKLWNKLPTDIRDLNSINKFKMAIKTCLFRQAFL